MRFSELPNHHAVLISHENRVVYSNELWDELRLLSPANRFFNATVLDIDTAREIISYASSSYSGEKVILISFHTASLPAQNAMLKILEEPKSTVRFIIITTTKDNLIGTVQSRMRHLHIGNTRDALSSHAYEFLLTTPSMRTKLPYVVTLLAQVDEEGRKDRESVKGFILSLAEVLQVNKVESKYILETLEIAMYASDPSTSGKALIEYLALLLPVVKA